MENKNINLDDIKENSYISEAGKYTLKIMDVETGTSANKNTEYHKYLCETKDGDKINVSLYLVENAMWKYKAFIKACGLPATGVVNVDELPNMLKGRKFIGEVKKQADRIDVATGLPIESKYYEVVKFYPVED